MPHHHHRLHPKINEAIMRYADVIWRPSHASQREMVENPLCRAAHHDGSPSVQNSAERFASSKVGVSPHFLIGQGGEIYQFVQLEDIAWHAKGGIATASASSMLHDRRGLKQWASLSERTRRNLSA